MQEVRTEEVTSPRRRAEPETPGEELSAFSHVKPILPVPERFIRNSAKVAALMPAEESGLWLLRRMQSQLGLADFTSTALLDFGCGVRFSQAIINRALPFGEYVGVDCFAEMIAFLRTTVTDPRFSYYWLDARHRLYNPSGTPLGPDSRLPISEGRFDVISMFSVLTHQYPDDASHILAMLRRYVRPTGRLFLTCFLDDSIDSFEDRSPEMNAGWCVYKPPFLENLIVQSGWQPTARYPGDAPLIGEAYVCQPVPKP